MVWWREGLIRPPKKIGVAPLTPESARPLAGRGEGKGGEKRKGRRGQRAGKGKEGKLEQGRRLAKAGHGNSSRPMN